MTRPQTLKVVVDAPHGTLAGFRTHEFQRRVHVSWDAFVERDDDRLVQFAYRRLFDRDATADEIALLRGVAANFGYAAFTTMLLSSKEYEQRYGRGLPARKGDANDVLELPE